MVKYSSGPIAIVGVGCRLPGGVVDPASFVRFIAERGDGIVPVPPDRWSLRRFFDPDPHVPGRTYASHGGFLRQDVFAFEPEPFGISPREAATLDPQQALLLEVAWEALEDAGIALDRIAGSATGVYMGAFGVDNQVYRLWGAGRRAIDQHIATAVTATMMSARLAYTFDLRGPTLTVDTACSSSLVAIHMACRAIRAGECGAALAGGAHVMVVPGMMTALAKGRFASADGRSKAFDVTGDGYGRGEGAAVVVLKPLHTAVADDDRIYGVIVGTAVNQDGRTDGITVPSGAAQEALIRAACADAGVAPEQIGYVEAHGTGTPVGDPIEARALGRVYGSCLMGSVKTNIGHLEAAAGVAGLLKACLMQREGRVLPQRGPAEVNPELGLDASGLCIATEERAWPAAKPLAAVNSFGYGGTNAHVIVAPAPPRAHAAPETIDDAIDDAIDPTPIPLSAYSDAALRARAADVIQWLDGGGDAADLGFTLARRRSHLAARACVVAGSRGELRGALEALRDGRDASEVVKAIAPPDPQIKTAWVFTGMGPQRAGMARELLAGEPVFRREVDACDALFVALSGWSVVDVLTDPARAASLARNDVAQVANFVVQAGLTALLDSLGARPDAIVGHSVGELGAAYAAGALSRADAVLLVHHRARASQAAAGRGTMLAAAVSEADAPFLIEPGDDACVAAVNGPQSVTFAGDRAALAKIARVLDGLGVFQRMLPVEVAYHSAHLEPARAELLRCWAQVQPTAPRVPLYSTVTGGRVEDAHDAAYWWRNLRQPVRFAQAARALIADGYRMFLEVGPHPVLAANLRALLDESEAPGQTLHTLARDRPERLEVRRAVAALHCHGARVEWSALHPRGSQVSLPAYPWQRAVHWTETAAMRTERLATDYVHPFLQTRLPTPNLAWTSWLEGAAAAYLRDHRVEDVPIAPAAFYIEAGLALARESAPSAGSLVLRRVRFAEPLLLQGDAMICVGAEADGRFAIHSRVDGRDAWTLHASGEWATDPARSSDAEPLAALRSRLAEPIDVAAAYAVMTRRRMPYGPAFRTVRELHRGAGEVLARLELSPLPDEARFAALLPPPLLDGVFQSLIALFGDDHGPVVVSDIGELSLVGPVGTELSSHARVTAHDDKGFTAYVTLYDADGAVVGHVRDVTVRNLDARAGIGEANRWLYTQRWQPLAAAGDLPGGAWAIYGAGALAAPLVERLRAHHRDAFDPRAAHHVVLIDPDDDLFAALSNVGALAHRLRAGGWSELTVITSGAVRARDDDRVSPAMTACWGFARAVEREVSPLRLRLIDAAPGADPGALVAALCIDGEHEVAVRGGALYTARLERLDLASLRMAADPAASCVAWSAEQAWVCLPSPPPHRVRIERVVTFGTRLAVSSAVDPDTQERGIVVTDSAPATELHVAPSAFWPVATEVTPSQLAAAVGRTVAHRLLRVPAGGAVWVAPSLAWLAACFDAAGIPRVGAVHAWVVATASELQAAPLDRCADVGMVGIVSAAGDEPPRWNALPDGWALARLPLAALHAKDLVEHLTPDDAAAAIATRPFVELAAPSAATPQAFDVSHHPIDARDLRTLRVSPDDTWWITGGTRGFGLAIAEWLLDHGARRLILSGRTGQIRDDDRARLAAKGKGNGNGNAARIDVCALDVGDASAVTAFVAALQARGTPPTAIVHAAAQYEVAPVVELDRAMFDRAFRAKALGAWHLHHATRELRIDHFILCSSVVALIGNPLQTAYAAANAYLDGLASLRRAQGLAARSVAWGAIADAGILAREAATARDLAATGLRGMTARDAWSALAALPPSAPETVAIFDGDWPQLFRALRLVPRARWGALQPADDVAATGDRVAAMLHGVAPAQHVDVVGAAVRARAAAVLRTAADQIDPARPLRDYGLDSLLAVELRVALDSHLGVEIPTMEILAGASARDLARAVLRVRAQ